MREAKIWFVVCVLAFSTVAIAQEVKKDETKVEVKKADVKADIKAEVKTEVKKVDEKAAPASQPAVSVASPVAAAPATATTVSTTTTVEMPWWKVLIREGLELVFAILGLLASVLVTVLMKKYGFEDYSAKVDDALGRAIGFAEQKSLQAAKLNGKPLGSAEKLALALDFVIEKAKEYKLPDKGKEWWTKKVEGWLGTSNIANGKK